MGHPQRYNIHSLLDKQQDLGRSYHAHEGYVWIPRYVRPLTQHHTHGSRANSDAPNSKAQYVRKLKQWRLEKNSTKDKWEFAASQVQKRRLEGKETEVIINGRPVPAKRLKKEMARYAGCESSSEKVLGTSYTTYYSMISISPFHKWHSS